MVELPIFSLVPERSPSKLEPGPPLTGRFTGMETKLYLIIIAQKLQQNCLHGRSPDFPRVRDTEKIGTNRGERGESPRIPPVHFQISRGAFPQDYRFAVCGTNPALILTIKINAGGPDHVFSCSYCSFAAIRIEL